MNVLVVVRAILTRKTENGEEISLGQRAPGKKFAGYWEHPGGKNDKGESLIETLTREVKEETNYDIEPEEEPIAVQIAEHDESNVQYVITYYKAKILNPDGFEHKEDSTFKWDWFTKENLPNNDKMLNCQGDKYISLNCKTDDHTFFTPST